MRIDVSEPEQCGCVTCVQHRSTLCIFKTKETEPSNVIGSSFTSVPVSSGHVQALSDSSPLGSTSTSSPVQSSSPIRSGTATPLAPPVTTPVDSEPAQSIDSTIFNWGVFNSKNAPADASASSTSSPVQSSSGAILSFRSAVTPVTSGSLPVPVFGSPPFAAPGPSISCSSQAPITNTFGSSTSLFCLSQTPVTNISGSGTSAASRPSIFGPMQSPVQASAPNTCTPFSFLPPQDSGKTASAYPSPFIGPPFGYTFPPAVQRPHDARKHDGFDFKPAAVTSPTSGCTACGATSSSSSSSYLGFNVATNPPSAATSLPGFYSNSGYCPLMFGTPNFAALGTTTPAAVQLYPMILGTLSPAAQGTSTPAVHLYPLILGTPNLAAPSTSTPAVQPYHMEFGSPNLAGQGTTPAVQPYPMMLGSLNLAAQGTTPAVQPYPMMFGSLNLAAQVSTPAVQPYPMMFGSPNLAAQVSTPAVQAYLGRY